MHWSSLIFSGWVEGRGALRFGEREREEGGRSSSLASTSGVEGRVEESWGGGGGVMWVGEGGGVEREGVTDY